MKEYRIVKRNSSGEMEQEITALLLQGWKLQGGLSSFFHPEFNVAVYHQAMTRENKKEESND